MNHNDNLKNGQWSLPRPMTVQEFKKLGHFIQTEFGIKMPPSKKTMLESRLSKRLRSLNMTNFEEYRDYLFSLKGLELEMPHLVDAVTTNKTDFFREEHHFDILYKELLPEWMERYPEGGRIMAWCAGCSNGKEPYTLAMVLNEFGIEHPVFDYNILATDISRQVLKEAERAVYPVKDAEAIPPVLRKKYLLRSRDRNRQLIRIVPELRKRVAFREMNLLQDISFREKMDIIFCRNVIIYFERPVQEALFRKLCKFLEPGGYLFIGHSETLNGMDLPLKQTRPTVYRKI
ncbi:MCP methyltransferase, CheR-type [Desulfonatronospira thiodismutans ASO3-1]|uniref:protein-glutamate O-methyltransferase n=1 Tax=Desulfonatronospira thiodismutans ASO3-1 TaxID=555779 RepID=D6SSS3_9BACT|nr:CheR family methyltransferase [Desulfonatronospira thiodismutans]EFI33739.1 MCP methyltransferase, CheR-type [Desulfonatronospira thiodismutans ASO3-1]